MMKRIFLMIGVVALAFTAPLGAKEQERTGEQGIGSAVSNHLSGALFKRGEYLVTIMGCNECHTPNKQGSKGAVLEMTKMLSGHPATESLSAAPTLPASWISLGSATHTAFAGPWGISYAANLTPDRETGLGLWTLETFIKTLRTGMVKGTERALQPPMPWQGYAQMTENDLKSLFQYLQSVPAVANDVPESASAISPEIKEK